MSTPTWGPDRPDQQPAGGPWGAAEPAPPAPTTGAVPGQPYPGATGAAPAPGQPYPGAAVAAPVPGQLYPREPAPTAPYPGAYGGAPSAYPGAGAAGAYPGAAPAAGTGAYRGPALPYPGSPLGLHAQPATDGLAVASLAVSAGSLLTSGLLAPVGLGLGIAALRRIRRTGAPGRGMAIAGIVIGSVLSAALTALVLIFTIGVGASVWGASGDDPAASTWPAPDDQGDTDTGAGAGPGPGGAATAGSTLPPFSLDAQLAPGSCLSAHPERYDMADAVVVDCATPHDTEVIGPVDLTAPVSTDLTVADAAFDAAFDTCVTQIEGLLGIDDTTTGIADLYYPHPDQWDAGGRTAYCVLVTDAPVTGSAVAGSLAPGATSGV